MENKEKKSVGFPVAHTVNLEGWMVFLAKQVDDEGGRGLSLCELKEKIKSSVKPKDESVRPEETEAFHHKMFVEILGKSSRYKHLSEEEKEAEYECKRCMYCGSNNLQSSFAGDVGLACCDCHQDDV